MKIAKVKISGLAQLPEGIVVDSVMVLGSDGESYKADYVAPGDITELESEVNTLREETGTSVADINEELQITEKVANRVPVSATATDEQYPTAKSVYDYGQEIAATIPAGGLRVPLSIPLESGLPDVSTLTVGDYYFIQNMDFTAPERTGRAWVNYTDPADTSTPLMYYKVFDQYQSMDGVSITQTGGGTWEVNPEWLQEQILADAVPISTSTPLMDGVASPGTERSYASGQHRHPTDTSRAALNGDYIQNFSANKLFTSTVNLYTTDPANRGFIREVDASPNVSLLTFGTTSGLNNEVQAFELYDGNCYFHRDAYVRGNEVWHKGNLVPEKTFAAGNWNDSTSTGSNYAGTASITELQNGIYRITHNIGNTDYTIFTMPISGSLPIFVRISSKQANYVDLVVFNTVGTPVGGSFDFELKTY